MKLVAHFALGLLLAACTRDAHPTPPPIPTLTPRPPAPSSTPTEMPASPTPTATPTGTPSPTPTATPTEPPLPTPTPTASATAAATPTAPPVLEPAGFPLDPATVLGLVTGEVGSRVIEWGAGPRAGAYSRDDQPSGDPIVANRSGWNCRVHLAYEGLPAVDWYIPTGTPIAATMDGFATLYAITVTNAFDYYGADREPYIGDPDRARAPLSPFPGPGGGKGVFVSVENDEFVTEYAHLDLAQTADAVPTNAWLEGYKAGLDLVAEFRALRGFQDATPLASWPVRRGDVIGFSGDAGYSEAPHLHYTVRYRGGGLLCPTAEAGFADGGWLFR